MLRKNKKFVSKIMVVSMICIMLISVPFSAAQTLGELQAQIDQIKEDTASKKEKQKTIESEKVSTEADIGDIKTQIDDINANISNKQAEIDSKNTEIATQNTKIADIQAKIPAVKADADKSLVVLQKLSNSNVMVEMVLMPNDNQEDNILRRMQSVNSLAEFAGGTILDLVEIEKELQYEKTVLEKDQAELESVEVELEGQQQTLATKQTQLEKVLANQTDASAEIDDSVQKAAEDQAMLQDTLDYYQSYGCTQDDVVGSKCGGLADDDGDGVINDKDSCPKQYGTKANGCPEPDTPGGGGSGGGGSGGGGSATFSRPLAHGVVTEEFGEYPGHTGTDMDNADWDPILATAGGTVITSRGGCDPWGGYPGNYCNGGYGNYVMLMHNTSKGTFFSLYGHMSSLAVSKGQTVSRGQKVGTLGHSGNSSGSHLHFELFKDTNGNGLPDDYKTNARNYINLPAKGVWW